MRAVNIAELKNRLSHYLEDVRRGEEVLIRDRDRPIAKIVPLTGLDDYESEEAELVATGILRPPKKERLPASFWKDKKIPQLSLKRAVKAVTDERDED